MKEKVLTLGLICSLMLGSVLSAEKKKKVNFFQGLFTDRIERVYIIMKDGMPFKYTDHYENKLYLSVGTLEEVLKKFKDENYRIKDIAIIIHNHLKNYRFSDLDRKEYGRLKKHGFNGLFMLYSHMTNKTYCIEEKKRAHLPKICPLLLTRSTESLAFPLDAQPENKWPGPGDPVLFVFLLFSGSGTG